jgi:hypothetical protein
MLGNLPPDLMEMEREQSIVIPNDEHDDFFVNTGM